MKSYSNFENLNVVDRTVRFAVSVFVIIGVMNSSIVGTLLFAVITLLAVGLATTAIIGWDPAKAWTLKTNAMITHKQTMHNGHQV